jgi:hypothetical protein
MDHEEEKVNNTSTSRKQEKKGPRKFGGRGKIKKNNDSKNKQTNVDPGVYNENLEATLLDEAQLNQ